MFFESDHSAIGEEFMSRIDENLSFPLHIHRSYECIAVLEGFLHIRIDEKEYTLHKGEAALVLPFCRHSYPEGNIGKSLLLIFTPELVASFHKEIRGRVPQNPIFDFSPELSALPFKNIYSEKAFLYGLCGKIYASTPFLTKKEGNDTDFLLNDMLSYMEDHISEDCSLLTLSQKLNYSYTYLSRYFHKKTDCPYPHYLNMFRISLACHLLRDESLKISDVARDVGYESLKSFNGNFKSLVGVTPGMYRRTHTEDLFSRSQDR